MRKFRNAALAAATATAVAFGGTAVAGAEETPKNPNNTSSSHFFSGWGGEHNGRTDATLGEVLKKGFEKTGEGKGSTGFGAALDRETDAQISNFWGKDTGPLPQWARIWRDSVEWFALLTGVGIVIGAGNYALHEGYLPQINWNQFNVNLPF